MTTVNQAIHRYEKVLKGYMAESSVKTYRSRLQFAAQSFVSRELASITLLDLEELLAAYRESRSNNTAALMVTVLKQFFRWCVEVDLRASDPSAKLRAPKRTKWQPRALSAAVVDDLLKAIQADVASYDYRQVRNETVVRLLIYAGLRRAEVVKLTWTDVDLTGKVFTITGKGDKIRQIPLHSSLVSYCKHLQVLAERTHGAVIARSDGTPLHPYTINVIFNRWIVQHLGFAITPHKLRHSFATRLIERGAELDQIRDLLGHESIATTQVYIRTTPERLRDAIERL